MSRRNTLGHDLLAPVATVGLALALVACNGGGNDNGTPELPGYKRDVEPIFRVRCNNCHFAGAPNGYDLTNPFDPEKGIIRRPNSWVSQGSKQTLVVDPGNVGNSFLITKVAEAQLDDHVDGSPMPLQIPRLTPAEVAAVEKWITDGAANDQYFADNVAPIFGTELRLGSAAGKCTYCHYPNAPSLMSVLDVFDPGFGMVNRASRFGGFIVAPGNPAGSSLMKKITGTTLGTQMPLNHDRLSPTEVDLMRQWIASGAENN